MAAGLEVFNSNGVSIIDTSYPNYGFVGKWKLSALPKVSIIAGQFAYPCLELSNRFAPILFFNSTSNPAVMVGNPSVGIATSRNNGSTFTYFFESYINAANGVDVTVFVFDLMSSILPTGASSGVGLESFTPSGALIFSSTIKPLRYLHQSIVADGAYVASQGGQVAYAGGNGTNGHNTGGAYADTWIVDNIPTGKTIAASVSRFRYGASGSSTEVSYGDALIERLTIENGPIPKVVLSPFGTGIANEYFGGFLGTVLDSVAGFQPRITVIDVTNY